MCVNIHKLQFYRVQVGIQSPEGITTIRGIQRRFNDFLKLFSDVSWISSCHFCAIQIPASLIVFHHLSLFVEMTIFFYFFHCKEFGGCSFKLQKFIFRWFDWVVQGNSLFFVCSSKMYFPIKLCLQLLQGSFWEWKAGVFWKRYVRFNV